MVKPDEKTLKALLNIKSYQGWELISKWISDSAMESLLVSAKADNDLVIKRHQGAALVLREILDVQLGADKSIERMQKDLRT